MSHPEIACSNRALGTNSASEFSTSVLEADRKIYRLISTYLLPCGRSRSQSNGSILK